MMNNIGELIKTITPLYNYYKQNRTNLSGVDSLCVMWDIGDILREYIEKNNIQPHTLFRQIYGKSEGATNILQKSYIPREFQGRCYRIRNIFPEKKEINEYLPKLKNFTCFREAMPFFDNPKFKFDKEDRTKLLQLLNSDNDYAVIIKEIKALQRERIGIKNPRTQRLVDVQPQKTIFVNFYNYVYKLASCQAYSEIVNNISLLPKEFLRLLSLNTNALTDEALKPYEMVISPDLPSIWKDYAEMINMLLNQPNPKNRRRFRRLVTPSRMSKLADMIYALISEENFIAYKS